MFDRLIGNSEIKATLRRMIRNGRVPRSLLLAGPEGTGKREFAFELARAFICAAKIDGEGCGKCPACVRCDKFTFPAPDAKKEHFERVFLSEHTDVGTVIPCRNNILVDAIRGLEREANYRPYEAEARFFIIDDADKMNDAASNALLKTLEEPPPTSHIFVITSRPDSLLPTIRSRCQILRFAPVPAAEIADLLTSRRQISHSDADLIARLSAGSVGRGMSFDLERFRSHRELMLGVIRGVVGRERPDFLALLKLAESLSDAKFKDDYAERLDSLQSLIHDVWSIKLGRTPESIGNADISADLVVLSRALESKRLAGWLREIEDLREASVLNLNKKITSDALFLGMAG
ncbi:MAG: DNA polymerase III subunit delta' [Acidobacteria bacterium]|nr:DNA polymerase III subunit delta' [Acidobacteriota bacterium]